MSNKYQTTASINLHENAERSKNKIFNQLFRFLFLLGAVVSMLASAAGAFMFFETPVYGSSSCAYEYAIQQDKKEDVYTENTSYSSIADVYIAKCKDVIFQYGTLSFIVLYIIAVAAIIAALVWIDKLLLKIVSSLFRYSSFW